MRIMLPAGSLVTCDIVPRRAGVAYRRWRPLLASWHASPANG
jgi:hypothetical protein